MDIEKELKDIAEIQRHLNNNFNEMITTITAILITKGIVTEKEFYDCLKDVKKELNNRDKVDV